MATGPFTVFFAVVEMSDSQTTPPAKVIVSAGSIRHSSNSVEAITERGARASDSPVTSIPMEAVRTAVVYEKSRSTVRCDDVRRRTDGGITVPWSAEPPVG